MDTALHLHNLGYEIPDMVMNLVLRQDQIIYNRRMIDEAVNMYNSVLDKLDKPQVSELLKKTVYGQLAIKIISIKRFFFLLLIRLKCINELKSKVTFN